MISESDSAVMETEQKDLSDNQAAFADAAKCSCTHCGLPVPKGLFQPNQPNQFCCSGCRGAYELIHESGLASFYNMATANREGQGQPVVPSETAFGEFDEPVFLKKYSSGQGNEESTIELAIDGIHCGACIWLIEKLPSICPGVVSAVANWARRTVKIRWRQNDVSLSTIASTLNRLGYFPSPIRPSAKRARWQKENQNHLVRIGVAAACAGNNMIISAALYFGMFSHMTAGMSVLFRASSCVVGIVALLWPGRVFLRSAISAIRTRTPHMDLPIALALTVGTLAGLVNVIRGAGEIYFDSLSVLIFLLLIGRWIQFRQQSKAVDAIEMLYQLTPRMTRKFVDGKTVDVLVDVVEVGDLLEILPGEPFPVDGEIVEGQTSVDESILTGESTLQLRQKGDPVAAGTRNKNSVVVIRASAVGRETRLSQIVEMVEEASTKKPKMVLWANQVGGYFVATVIGVSALTFSWWLLQDVEVAIDRTIALLIVACPCALALATPLAIGVALGRAAKNQIMIKGGDVLQSLQSPGTIWLDKTGTITEGNLQVVRWFGAHSWIDFAAAIESKSGHPVAHAICKFAQTVWTPCRYLESCDCEEIRNGHLPVRTCVSEFEDHQGLGVSGAVGKTSVVIGNQKLLKRLNIDISDRQQSIARRQTEKGLSPCWLAVDGRVVALIALGDAVRPEAHSAIQSLRQRGWNVGILSGDQQPIVDRVAKRVGIEAHQAKGGVEPEEKLRYVTQSANRGTTVMIGDGVNDSAALAAAHVGIAVKGGAEACLAAAPVYFAKPGLAPVIELLDISDSSSRTMRNNLAVSLAYNISFAALAFAGFINPLVAAIVMPISSITVVAISLGSGKARLDSSGDLR